MLEKHRETARGAQPTLSTLFGQLPMGTLATVLLYWQPQPKQLALWICSRGPGFWCKSLSLGVWRGNEPMSTQDIQCAGSPPDCAKCFFLLYLISGNSNSMRETWSCPMFQMRNLTVSKYKKCAQSQTAWERPGCDFKFGPVNSESYTRCPHFPDLERSFWMLILICKAPSCLQREGSPIPEALGTFLLPSSASFSPGWQRPMTCPNRKVRLGTERPLIGMWHSLIKM